MRRSAQGTVKAIMGLELRRFLFNPVILLAGAVFLLCLFLAVLYSTQVYQWNVRQYEETVAPREDSPVANLSAVVVVRPIPLHIIARGTSDILARPVAAMRQLEAAFNIKYSVGQDRRQIELIYSLFDDVDPLFVMRMLLPVFALLLSHGFICGERRRATLRQILANAVTRRSILTGKILAGAVMLLLLLVLAAFVLLITLWMSGIDTTFQDLWRIGIIMFATYLYGFVFLMLGALVSTSVRNPDVSILVCLVLWCLLVIVAPGTAAGAAELLKPVPPAHFAYAKKLALERNMRGGDAMEGTAEEMRDVNAALLEQIGGIDNDYFNAVRGQERIARGIGLVSPSLGYESIVTSLAGSSIDEEHELMRQVRRHFREIARFDDVESNLFARETPDELPAFDYEYRDAAAVLTANVAEWSALTLYACLLLFLSYLFFDRYDVR